MRKGLFFSIALILFSCFFLNNCTKAPVYPDAPQIEFNNVAKYVNGDSLIVTVYFKDGDGDLGLRNEDTGPPYHEYDFERDGSGNVIRFGSSPSLPPYSCADYDTLQYDGNGITDTLLIKKNINYFNYHIDIYVKQPDNSYLKYDFTSFCLDFNGRFPLLNSLENRGPIEGTLSYTLKDLFFNFSGETLKFKIFIIDRALHKSNVIETPDIVMN